MSPFTDPPSPIDVFLPHRNFSFLLSSMGNQLSRILSQNEVVLVEQLLRVRVHLRSLPLLDLMFLSVARVCSLSRFHHLDRRADILARCRPAAIHAHDALRSRHWACQRRATGASRLWRIDNCGGESTTMSVYQRCLRSQPPAR